jgi:hypothetical protein
MLAPTLRRMHSTAGSLLEPVANMTTARPARHVAHRSTLNRRAEASRAAQTILRAAAAAATAERDRAATSSTTACAAAANTTRVAKRPASPTPIARERAAKPTGPACQRSTALLQRAAPRTSTAMHWSAASRRVACATAAAPTASAKKAVFASSRNATRAWAFAVRLLKLAGHRERSPPAAWAGRTSLSCTLRGRAVSRCASFSRAACSSQAAGGHLGIECSKHSGERAPSWGGGIPRRRPCLPRGLRRT